MFAPITHYLSKDALKKLEAARVGIAGAGGLGSNCAMMLTRSGVGHLSIIDGDTVEERNLNRQHYFPRHIGMLKVEALRMQLMDLSPELSVQTFPIWLDADNIPALLDLADIWIEALDIAQSKSMFVSLALKARKTVVSGSGMAGLGRTLMKRQVLVPKHGGLLALVGDFQSDIAFAPPFAPRVAQCAAMQADAALEWLLTGNIKPLH